MCVVNPITMVEILSNYIYYEKVKEKVKSIKKLHIEKRKRQEVNLLKIASSKL